MNKHLVSIIIPTYNRGYIIGNAIQGVLNQTIPDWELLIVDDGSGDNTEEIVEAFSDPRIIYIRNEENKGANIARNCGCAAAKGDFLAFLDSDNRWNENMIKRHMEALQASEDDVAFSFCKQEVIDESVHIFPSVEFDVDHLEETLRKGNVVDTNTVILKREVFEAVGGFAADMPRMQDWEFFFRVVVVHGYKAIFIPEILDTNVVQANSISKDKEKYCQALNRFLSRHYKYFTLEEIGGHLISLGRSLPGGDTAEISVKNWMDGKKDSLEGLLPWMARQIYRQFRYYDVLLHWKEKMEQSEGRTVFSGLALDGAVIALYGLGRWGELIYHEMKNCGIKISFGIDRKVRQFHGIKVIGIHEIPEYVDLIIVSIFQEYAQIARDLSQHFSGKILSIEDLAYETIRNGER